MSRPGPLVAPEDPWSGYVSTVVEVVLPGHANLVVVAAPPGEAGKWPWPTADVVYVLTAWDPGDQRFSETVNRARLRRLEAELRPRVRGLWGARGFDPESGYRDEGLAVHGLPESDVLAAGARFGQDAVFAWTADEWAIVACSGRRRLSLGWCVTSADPGSGA